MWNGQLYYFHGCNFTANCHILPQSIKNIDKSDTAKSKEAGSFHFTYLKPSRIVHWIGLKALNMVYEYSHEQTMN